MGQGLSPNEINPVIEAICETYKDTILTHSIWSLETKLNMCDHIDQVADMLKNELFRYWDNIRCASIDRISEVDSGRYAKQKLGIE